MTGKFILPLIALAVAPAAGASTPLAEIVCAPSSEMVTRLRQNHGVERQAMGMRDPDTLLELWSSQETGDWTVVVTYASGQSCIVAMGQHWTPEIPEPA